jgi:hypothetical protein
MWQLHRKARKPLGEGKFFKVVFRNPQDDATLLLKATSKKQFFQEQK